MKKPKHPWQKALAERRGGGGGQREPLRHQHQHHHHHHHLKAFGADEPIDFIALARSMTPTPSDDDKPTLSDAGSLGFVHGYYCAQHGISVMISEEEAAQKAFETIMHGTEAQVIHVIVGLAVGTEKHAKLVAADPEIALVPAMKRAYDEGLKTGATKAAKQFLVEWQQVLREVRRRRGRSDRDVN
jgi:hypothetical protein